MLVLQPLHADDLRTIIDRACADPERGLGGRVAVEPAAVEALVNLATAMRAPRLNILETAADMASLRTRSSLSVADIEEAAQRRALRYDKAGDEHYNIASAFIKSMRGSDPDATVYWMLRMLEAGDDPLFVARRMVIFAAEDVGLADPQALAMAVAAKDAVEFVGLPEGKIPLAEAAVYLATAPKSNSTYAAMLAAGEDVRTRGPLPVPLHLRNAPTRLMRELGYGKGYQYAHAQPDQAVRHSASPTNSPGGETGTSRHNWMCGRCPASPGPSGCRSPAPGSLARADGIPYLACPRGAVAQLGERLNGIQEVGGSTPLSSPCSSV